MRPRLSDSLSTWRRKNIKQIWYYLQKFNAQMKYCPSKSPPPSSSSWSPSSSPASWSSSSSSNSTPDETCWTRHRLHEKEASERSQWKQTSKWFTKYKPERTSKVKCLPTMKMRSKVIFAIKWLFISKLSIREGNLLFLGL